MYRLLNPEAVAALKKYNTEVINKFAKKRGIDVTDIDDHESPPSEDTIHEKQPDPQQFEDAPENEIDPILDYISSQHHQEEDMNNALQAYTVMASSTPGSELSQALTNNTSMVWTLFIVLYSLIQTMTMLTSS